MGVFPQYFRIPLMNRWFFSPFLCSPCFCSPSFCIPCHMIVSQTVLRQEHNAFTKLNITFTARSAQLFEKSMKKGCIPKHGAEKNRCSARVSRKRRKGQKKNRIIGKSSLYCFGKTPLRLQDLSFPISERCMKSERDQGYFEPWV